MFPFLFESCSPDFSKSWRDVDRNESSICSRIQVSDSHKNYGKSKEVWRRHKSNVVSLESTGSARETRFTDAVPLHQLSVHNFSFCKHVSHKNVITIHTTGGAEESPKLIKSSQLCTGHQTSLIIRYLVPGDTSAACSTHWKLLTQSVTLKSPLEGFLGSFSFSESVSGQRGSAVPTVKPLVTDIQCISDYFTPSAL